MGSYLRKNWKKSALVCLLQIVEWGFQAGVQLLLMQVFDKALSLDLKAFLFWSAVDMAAWGGYFLVCYLRESAQARVVRALNNDLRHDLCCQLLQKGYQDYHKQDSGEYLSWMTNDIKQIEQLAWNPFFNCVGRASQVLWGIVVLLSLHWSLMAASLVSALIMWALPKLFEKRLEQLGRLCSERQAAGVSALKDLLSGLDKYNNIYMMADSGARGSDKQIKQLAGMRGLMADTTGHTIELPIKSNFREGLDVLEYFMSAHGARKGLSDTALRTADSGYLTRRLVDVSQELIIHDVDCVDEGAEIPGMYVRAFMDGNEEIESLQERITGRYLCEDIKDKDGNVLVKANHMVTPKRAELIAKKGVDENGEPLTKIKIRTILTCRSHRGVCAKCYGANMATGEPVQVGEAVGIIAAQSIGEPGTQLTMRTFHTGGVAGDDITQGLPRVEELFEARKPKGLAIITEFAGTATINDTKKRREIIVTNHETGESKAYLIPYGSRIKIQDGAELEAGDELTEGSVNPHDILKIKGLRAVQDYMLQEVQRVYRLQGVDINDKHIEVIVRQMLKKVRVEEAGDTEFLPGTNVDRLVFEDVNEQMEKEGKTPATGEQIMLGITKASLATNSFLSAASFQETTKVLTEAAIKGKIDPLVGLKENVIIGKHIPAGTGMHKYRDIRLDTDMSLDDEIMFSEEELEGEDTVIGDAGTEELPDTAEEGVFAEAAPEEAVTAEE